MKADISKGKLVVILALVAPTLIALAFLATKLSTLQVFKIEGRDMEPTLHEGNRVLITKEFGQLQRGDIVIFKYPADPNQNFLKRIVGLPGEVIEVNDGKVYINGNYLEEKYIDPQLNRFPFHKNPTRIPEGSYFLLGDNRDFSNDSRLLGVTLRNTYLRKSSTQMNSCLRAPTRPVTCFQDGIFPMPEPLLVTPNLRALPNRQPREEGR